MVGILKKLIRWNDALGHLPAQRMLDDGTDSGAAAAVYSPGGFFTATAAFNRPADTTVYASGQRIATATSGAAVLKIADVMRAAGEAARIERVRLRKTGPSLTNASFRVHLFRLAPTVNVNDKGAFNASGVLAVADIAGYVTSIDITMNRAGVAGAVGAGLPETGSGITCESSTVPGDEAALWAVIEATAAYTPAASETFTVIVEGARS